MAITLDGIEYTINNEAFDIASDMARYINEYCERFDIVNSQGERMRVDVNDTSIIWLILLANGYRDGIIERMIYAVSLNFNISLCSDEQLLNLAKIMRTQRKKSSPTTTPVSIEALDTGDVHITKSVKATVVTNEGEMVFSPAYESVIPSGSVRSVIFMANKNGPYRLNAGAITTFDAPVDNVGNISNGQGMAGNSVETVNQLRQRIAVNDKGLLDSDLAKQAIESLPGISFCNIFVNHNNTYGILMNGITIPPRRAAVYISGYNEMIAREYFKYMTMLTVGENIENAISLSYRTLDGQTIPFYYFTPVFITIYVKVIIDIQVIDERVESVQEYVMGLNGLKGIGDQITSADVMNVFKDAQKDYNVLGVLISMDGSNWNISSNINMYEILTITRDNIIVKTWGEE
jgi:hypothetical protein